MSKIGRPRGTGWVEQALQGIDSPFAPAAAAKEIGTSAESVAHTARNMVGNGTLIRVRHGLYRHLTVEEWEVKWERDGTLYDFTGKP